MHKPWRLKNYLLLFAVVLVVPLLTGVALATLKFVRSEQQRLVADTSDANHRIAIQVDQEIATRAAMLQALAAAGALQADNDEAFRKKVEEISRLSGVAITVFDSSGQELINTQRPPGRPLPMTADPDLVQEVFGAKRNIYVSDLFLDPVTQQPQVQVAVPLQRGDGTQQILAAVIPARRLVEVVQGSLPKGAFYATVLDRHGVIIARSIMPDSFVGKPLLALANGAVGKEGSLTLTSADNKPVFAYWRRSPVSGWLVAAAIESAVLSKPLWDSFRSLLLSAGVLAALAALCAGLVSRRLTHAHHSLIKAAEALGGERLVEPEATRLHEANLVAGALFDASRSIIRHAEEMQSANLSLERRVLSRTEELKTKTALLETTINTMTQGLLFIDARGDVPVSNVQARRMLGLPDELMDRPPSYQDVVSFLAEKDEYGDMSPEAMSQVMPQPDNCPSVIERTRPDGTILEVHTAPVSNGGGFVRTFTDITEERRNDRAVELAKIAAENANRAKGDFLATMSHEMRTPLNAVIGYSDLLLSRKDMHRDARRNVERVRAAGAALLGLVDNVLDLGKIEAGVIDVRHEPFLLPALVEEALSIVRPSAFEKRIDLKVHIFPMSDAFRVGDQDRLRQVLVNLLSNAIKFTHVGHVELSVSETHDEDSVPHIRFVVADTGIGIAEVEQPNLFQRFHQIDPAIDRRFGGAGLGLAICKQLVERMDGTIGLKSSLGSGSSFWFEVPLAPAAPTAEVVSLNEAQPVTARILVAEDVLVNQDLARELLETAGHSVEVVSDGMAAVKAVRKGKFDLVLMDLSMPGMDGLTATQIIRTGARTRQTPIIACTANVMPTQINALRDVGIVAILRKPLQRSELDATIQRVLQSRGELVSMEPAPAPETSSLWSIVALLGPTRIVHALDKLTESLNSLTIDDMRDIEQCRALAERAHAVISTASMLELTELAQGCRDLENACRESAGIDLELRKLRPIVEDALVKSELLRKDLLQAA